MKQFGRDLRDLAMIFAVCLVFTLVVQTAVSKFVPVVSSYPGGIDDDNGPTPDPYGGDGYSIIQPVYLTRQA